MEKTIFKISQMDCPSEENLIRMKLEGIAGIRRLDFDLQVRELTVFHESSVQPIEHAIQELRLGGQKLSSESVEETGFDESRDQRQLLWTVLIINFGFFIIEMSTGLLSRSMALVADSLDMLADAFVYGISLMAVGGSLQRKKQIAKWAGYAQLTLALIGFIEVLRRFLGDGAIPESRTMIVVSVFALIANGICLYLLQMSRSKEEAHMKASMIFTSNDVIINLGVIVAGLLVLWLKSGWPDLLIGSLVFFLVVQGALRMLKLGK